MGGWPPRIAVIGPGSTAVIEPLAHVLRAAGLTVHTAPHAPLCTDMPVLCDVALTVGHARTTGAALWVSVPDRPDPPPPRTPVLDTLASPGELDRARTVVLDYLASFHDTMPVWAAVLVGGASRRMGRPKTMLTLAGRFVLDHIVDVAGQVAVHVVLVGTAPLPDTVRHVPCVPDAPNVQGPLAGVLGAMGQNAHVRWLVLACDLVTVHPEAVRWLLSQAGPGRWAVLPHLDQPRHREPVFAVYDPPAVPLLEAGAQRGERAICRILDDRSTYSPRVPAHLRDAWTNVNAPADLDALHLRHRARKSS